LDLLLEKRSPLPIQSQESKLQRSKATPMADFSKNQGDADLEVRVSAFCKAHAALFEQEVDDYVRRCVLKSWICFVMGGTLILSSILITWRTGHSAFLGTRLLSAALLIAYPLLSPRFKIMEREASLFVAMVIGVVTLESVAIFKIYQTIGLQHLMPQAAPFLIAVATWSVSLHRKRRIAILLSGIYTVLLLGLTGWVSPESLQFNGTYVLCGAGLGLVLNNNLYQQLRYKLYVNQTERHLRTHAYQQLEKVVFPHQRRMIEDGQRLEQTMPVGIGEACILAFDVVQSSRIRSAKSRLLLQNVLKRCHQAMMQNYNEFKLEANAYRIKEMGDGLLCSVGFPFQTPGGQNKEILAVQLAQSFIRIFHEEARALLPNEPVFCCVGISMGPIEAFYPHSYPMEYDIFGRPLVLATRYEAARKELFHYIEPTSLIILHEDVYKILPDEMRKFCHQYDLEHFRIRDDQHARTLYFQTFDQEGQLIAPGQRKAV
jgi:class 3 adenylate cyclase